MLGPNAVGSAAPMPEASTATLLALSEGLLAHAETAPWIGPLLALGRRAARYSRRESGRQVVVAISVPARDFAAVLVGCGWTLASPTPQLDPPIDVMRRLQSRTPVRVVTEQEVLTDYFSELCSMSASCRT